MSRDTIGFIVPTFNRATMIGDTLDAILRQARPHDVVLVANDGSSDDTAEVVAGYGPRVRMLSLENGGKSRALNHALATLDTEWVWICDDDDILADGAVDALIAAATRTGGDFVFGSFGRFQDGQPPSGALGPGYWPKLDRGTIDRHLLEDFFIFQNASLVRRALYQRAGAFDETLPRSIDYDMALRLSALSDPVFVDRDIFYQRQHSGLRGPSSHRHSAEDMVSVWTGTDIQIFARFRDDATLPRFEAPYQAGESWERARAGHLLRATVMARHGHIEQARRDWHAASSIRPDMLLSRVERETLGRVLAGKFNAAQAPTPHLMTMLRAMQGGSALEQQMAAAIVSGGMWRMRHGDGDYRASQLALMREGNRSLAASGLDYVMKKIAPGDRPSALGERSATIVTVPESVA